MEIYKSVILYFKTRWMEDNRSLFDFNKKTFNLKTQSQSPVGGGLGGSSSLMISMLKAFAIFYNYSFKDNHHLVNVAHNLESMLLKTPTGTQDYYPAVNGGINILKYTPDGIQQTILNIESESYLAKHFLLVYTGKSHHSGINNFDVLKKSVQKDQNTLDALQDVCLIAQKTLETIRNNNYNLLPDLFKSEFIARTKLSESFASPEIKKLNELAQMNKGLGLKICGAGGGGCVLILVTPENRENLINIIEKNGFTVLKTKPVEVF
jgi:D-glycero-alpha-D-manno-heptose-7-phosphate kinase